MMSRFSYQYNSLRFIDPRVWKWYGIVLDALDIWEVIYDGSQASSQEIQTI